MLATHLTALLVASLAHWPQSDLTAEGSTGNPAAGQSAQPEQDRSPKELLKACDEKALAKLRLAADVDGPDAVLKTLRSTAGELRQVLLRGGHGLRDESLAYALGKIHALEFEILEANDLLEEAWSLYLEYSNSSHGGTNTRAVTHGVIEDSAALQRVRERREAARKEASKDVDGASLDGVRTIVQHSLKTAGGHLTLGRLGASISGVLAEIVMDADHPAELLATPQRPLAWLWTSDPKQAARSSVELLERPGHRWDAVVLNGITQGGVANLLDGATAAEAAASQGLRVVELLHSSPAASSSECFWVLMPFLAKGVDTPFTREAAKRGLKAGHWDLDDMDGDQYAWLVSSLSTDSDEEVRETCLILRLSSGVDVQLLEAYASDRSAGVRAAAAGKLQNLSTRSAESSPAVQALWETYLGDVDPTVRAEAYDELRQILQGNWLSPLGPLPLARMLKRLEDPSEQAIASSLMSHLKGTTRNMGMRSESPQVMGRGLAQIVASPLAERVGVWDALHEFAKDRDVMVTFLRQLDWEAVDDARLMNHLRTNYQVLYLLPSEFALPLYAEMLSRPGVSMDVIDPLLGADGGQSRGAATHDLSQLAPEQAIQVMLDARVLRGNRAARFMTLTGWSAMEAQLQAILREEHRASEHKAVAALALIQGSSTQPKLAEAFVDACRGLAELADSSSLEACLGLAGWVLEDKEELRLQVFRGLVAERTIATPLLSSFRQVEFSTAPEALATTTQVLDAMELRMAQGIGETRVPFLEQSVPALEAMQAAPGLFRQGLVEGWGTVRGTLSGGGTESPRVLSAARAAHAAERMDLLEEIRRQVVAQLNDFHGSTARTGVMATLLAIPGDESVQQLLSFAESTPSPAAQRDALSMIRAAVELREAVAELRGVGSSPRSQAQAVSEVLALLDHESEAVRLEAIRGLATLGAVEELPRLIGLLATGSPAEQKAASEALDSLHQRSAKAPIVQVQERKAAQEDGQD